MKQTYINQLKDSIGESVTLKGGILVASVFILFVFNSGACRSASGNATVGEEQVPTPATVVPQAPSNRERTQGSVEDEPDMPILKEIEKYQKANPSARTQDLANRGNELLPTMGFEFDIDLGGLIEKALKSKKVEKVKKDGYDDEYIYLAIPLVTETGRRTAVRVVAPTFESCCCGYTYTPIPVTQIGPTRMTVVIDGKPNVIRRTKDLPVVQEYILYAGVSSPKKRRSWEAPFETYPYGLSADGRSVYFETDIKELLLEVAADGKLRFVDKGSPNIITDKEDLRQQPAPKVGEILRKSGELGLYKYMIAGKPFVLEFPYVCT